MRKYELVQGYDYQVHLTAYAEKGFTPLPYGVWKSHVIQFIDQCDLLQYYPKPPDRQTLDALRNKTVALSLPLPDVLVEKSNGN